MKTTYNQALTVLIKSLQEQLAADNAEEKIATTNGDELDRWFYSGKQAGVERALTLLNRAFADVK